MSNINDYIKLFLETRAYMQQPHKIGAELQNKLSPKLRNDKTNLSPEEVVKDLNDKFGDDIVISFVRGYKGKVPSIEINPYARFATPHGIYSYLLTKENLSDLFLRGHVKGVDFAMDRPYFHIMKITTQNKAYIMPDGTSNVYNNNDKRKFMHDVQEMVRTALISQVTSRRSPDRKINAKNYTSTLYRVGHSSSRVARAIHKAYDAVCLKAPEGKKVDLNKFTENVAIFLDFLIDKKVKHTVERKSRYHKDYKSSKVILDKKPGHLFLKLYKIADILSYITPNPKQGSGRHNDPSRLSLLLRNVNIEAIIDKGFGLLHHLQPSQAVAINYGGGSKDNQFSSVENLGTYRNIFKYCSDEELEELFISHADYLH